MKQAMTDEELADAVQRIELQHREDLVRTYAATAAGLMLGLPLVTGLIMLLTALLQGGSVDFAGISWAVGMTFAAGVAFGGLYWAGLKIWARGLTQICK